MSLFCFPLTDMKALFHAGIWLLYGSYEVPVRQAGCFSEAPERWAANVDRYAEGKDA